MRRRPSCCSSRTSTQPVPGRQDQPRRVRAGGGPLPAPRARSSCAAQQLGDGADVRRQRPDLVGDRRRRAFPVDRCGRRARSWPRSSASPPAPATAPSPRPSRRACRQRLDGGRSKQLVGTPGVGVARNVDDALLGHRAFVDAPGHAQHGDPEPRLPRHQGALDRRRAPPLRHERRVHHETRERFEERPARRSGRRRRRRTPRCRPPAGPASASPRRSGCRTGRPALGGHRLDGRRLRRAVTAPRAIGIGDEDGRRVRRRRAGRRGPVRRTGACRRTRPASRA